MLQLIVPSKSWATDITDNDIKKAVIKFFMVFFLFGFIHSISQQLLCLAYLKVEQIKKDQFLNMIKNTHKVKT